MAKSLKILSIDDSKAVHAYLDRCFTETSHQLVHAMNAKDGIELLKISPNDFSIILLDWEMPEMNGPEALDCIIEMGVKVPVVMVTTKNNPEEIMDMLARGAKEFIMKPFTPEIMIDKVESVSQLSVSHEA